MRKIYRHSEIWFDRKTNTVTKRFANSNEFEFTKLLEFLRENSVINIFKDYDYSECKYEILCPLEINHKDLYYKMPYYPYTLKTFLVEHQLDEDQKRRLCYNIAMSIAQLHINNIIHRDIKPDNIFIRIIDSKPIVVLADFGSARFVNGASDYYSNGISTLRYRYDKLLLQDSQKYNYEIDIWSLGVVFFEILYEQKSAAKNPEEQLKFYEVMKKTISEDKSRKGLLLHKLFDNLPSIEVLLKSKYFGNLADKEFISSFQNIKHANLIEKSKKTIYGIVRKMPDLKPFDKLRAETLDVFLYFYSNSDQEEIDYYACFVIAYLIEQPAQFSYKKLCPNISKDQVVERTRVILQRYDYNINIVTASQLYKQRLSDKKIKKPKIQPTEVVLVGVSGDNGKSSYDIVAEFVE